MDFLEFYDLSVEAADNGPSAGRAEIEREVGLGHRDSFRDRLLRVVRGLIVCDIMRCGAGCQVFRHGGSARCLPIRQAPRIGRRRTIERNCECRRSRRWRTVNPFLTLTMVWCYDQIRSLTRYRPVVLTQARRNEDEFPVATLHSSENLPRLRRSVYRVIRKFRGTYAGYGNVLREERAGIVHAHFGQEGYFCLAARRSARVPMVTTFYGMDASALPRRRLWRRRFGRLFREGELFLVEGPHMGESLVLHRMSSR